MVIQQAQCKFLAQEIYFTGVQKRTTTVGTIFTHKKMSSESDLEGRERSEEAQRLTGHLKYKQKETAGIRLIRWGGGGSQR